MSQLSFLEALTTLPVAFRLEKSARYGYRRRTSIARPVLKHPDPKAKAKRAALNALRRARRAAENAAIPLSDWEGEFLGSVEGRVAAYGKAFRDPEKGLPGSALSLLQTGKLKEITAKARGKKKSGRGFRRSRFGD
jgi:hypothetical protein